MAKKDVTTKVKAPLDDSEWRFDKVPKDLWSCLRDYEFIREVFLWGAPKPEWTTNVVELDTGFKEIRIPANEGRGRNERALTVPPEFPHTPFLKLPNSSIFWYEDLLEYEEHEAESRKDLGNPLSQFDPSLLLTLIPPALLRKNLYGVKPLEAIPREEPGKDYIPRTQAEKKRDKEVEEKMLKERKKPHEESEAELAWKADRANSGLLRVLGNFVHDYDAADLSPRTKAKLEQLSADEKELKQLRVDQFGEDWTNHFWRKVKDWDGKLHGEDLDDWLKTFQDDAGSCWSVAAFRLDWAMTNQAIVDWFRAWLFKHRPHEGKKQTARDETVLRLELERLATLRLWRSLGTHKWVEQVLQDVARKDFLTGGTGESSAEKNTAEARTILREEFDCEVRVPVVGKAIPWESSQIDL